MAGEHEVHLYIHDEPLQGSPVAFTVLPNKPDPAFCKLSPPAEPHLFTESSHSLHLATSDKFGNECTTGGLTLATRLQLVKQTSRDQTALVPSNHTVGWEDNGDGTYRIDVSLSIPCTLKLVLNIDKNLPALAGELPPLVMQFFEKPEVPTRTPLHSPRARARPRVLSRALRVCTCRSPWRSTCRRRARPR